MGIKRYYPPKCHSPFKVKVALGGPQADVSWWVQSDILTFGMIGSFTKQNAVISLI